MAVQAQPVMKGMTVSFAHSLSPAVERGETRKSLTRLSWQKHNQ
jgi:hypothetical protein